MKKVIIKINLKEKYQPEIKGLGEIYEMISVSFLQRELIKVFKNGVLFLSPNKEHRGRGLTKEELEEYVKKQGYQVLARGFVDSPPWTSNPKRGKPRKLNKNLIFFAKIIFWFLVRLEFLWQGEKRSHMIFCLGKTKV